MVRYKKLPGWVFFCLLTIFRQAIARTVTVAVDATWSQHPASYLLELAEFVHDQSPKSFWQYVDVMCSSHTALVDKIVTSSADSMLTSDAHNAGMTVATGVVDASMHSLMETMVGMGYYSPAVQFYSSLSEPFGNPCQGAAFAIMYPSEVVVCSIDQLSTMTSAISGKRDIGDVDIESKLWDHIYPPLTTTNTPDNSVPKVVLYGVLGSSSFCSLHHAIVLRMQQGNLRYSARHAFPGSSISSDWTGEGVSAQRLQGYGVFLDLKNMEYKNIDDSDDNAATSASTGGTSGTDKGSDDKELASTEGSAGGGGAEVEVSVDELPEVKKIKDLGLQTLASVVRAANPMQRFRDIVEGFPKAAPLLSKKRVSKALRDEVIKVWQSGLSQTLPMNGVFINGLRVDLGGNTFNVYDLLAEMRTELSQLGQLKAALPGLTPSSRAALIDAAAKMDRGGGAGGGDYESPSGGDLTMG